MKAILILGAALFALGAGPGAQDPLGAAKDLYVSAAYEEALSALSALDGSAAPEIARQVDEYRAFCLFALGRTREAEVVAESMIRKDPLFQLDAADVSPRIEQMFSDVRKRLLPSLIRERFKDARAALDKKSFSVAEPPLAEARLMILEAQKLGVKDEDLGDLSVLVEGFLQLIQSTAEQRVAPRPASAPTPPATAAADLAAPPASSAPPASGSVLRGATAPPPASASASRGASAPPPANGGTSRGAPTPPPANGAASRGASAPPPANGAASRVAPAASRPAAGSPRVYSLDDEDVTPPVAIDQRMPAMPMEMTLMVKALHTTGVLDIIIDETGSVVDATIRRSVNVGFDNVILRSARRWKYQPAMKDGRPVSYLKTIALIP